MYSPHLVLHSSAVGTNISVDINVDINFNLYELAKLGILHWNSSGN